MLLHRFGWFLWVAKLVRESTVKSMAYISLTFVVNTKYVSFVVNWFPEAAYNKFTEKKKTPCKFFEYSFCIHSTLIQFKLILLIIVFLFQDYRYPAGYFLQCIGSVSVSIGSRIPLYQCEHREVCRWLIILLQLQRDNWDRIIDFSFPFSFSQTIRHVSEE